MKPPTFILIPKFHPVGSLSLHPPTPNISIFKLGVNKSFLGPNILFKEKNPHNLLCFLSLFSSFHFKF